MCGLSGSALQRLQEVLRVLVSARQRLDPYARGLAHQGVIHAMEEAGVPWAFINGNHDLGDRSWELGYDMNRSLFPLSITRSLFNGTNSTYMHSVLGADGSETARANLWFFDSGADNCLNVQGYNCVSEAQIEWYRDTAATEAARACIAWAAEHAPSARVVAFTHPENNASQRVLLKLGMRYLRMDEGERFYALDAAAPPQ